VNDVRWRNATVGTPVAVRIAESAGVIVR
jgi:hypothetical protein